MMPEYVTKRTKICRNCPICDQENEICSPDLYINPVTDEISRTAKTGFIKGCGCHLKFKIKNPNSHCPAHKWNAEY